MVAEKECFKCKEIKPRSDFYQDKRRRSGLRARCKKCDNKTQAQIDRKISLYHTNKNKEEFKKKERWRRIKSTHGITEDQYMLMFKQQNESCAICLEKRNEPLFVDHDHLTGKVRGLLCKLCNSGIGLFKENISSLNRAIDYIKLRSGEKG